MEAEHETPLFSRRGERWKGKKKIEQQKRKN